MSESTTEATTTEAPAEAKAKETKTESFTQADVDRIVADRLKREREKVTAKYGDYDDLKAKAGEAQTAEQRIAALEQQIQSSQQEALKRRVQASHGISDEDADLFLTGTDEDTLTAQAVRLAAREAERKKQGNFVPTEGTSTRPADTEAGAFAQRLFAGD